MLRVSRLPSRRRWPRKSHAPHRQLSGFWRSSVRGPGPPAENCGRFCHRRRRAWTDGIVDDSTVGLLCQQTDSFVLRVARLGARTRCRSSIANCPTGVREDASRPVGNGGEVSAPIPVLTANLCDIVLNHTKGRRDF